MLNLVWFRTSEKPGVRYRSEHRVLLVPRRATAHPGIRGWRSTCQRDDRRIRSLASDPIRRDTRASPRTGNSSSSTPRSPNVLRGEFALSLSNSLSSSVVGAEGGGVRGEREREQVWAIRPLSGCSNENSRRVLSRLLRTVTQFLFLSLLSSLPLARSLAPALHADFLFLFSAYIYIRHRVRRRRLFLFRPFPSRARSRLQLARSNLHPEILFIVRRFY